MTKHRARHNKLVKEKRLIYILTAVGIGLGAVAILKAARPGALVLGGRGGRLPHPVAALEALGPLAAIQPATARLHTETMSLAVLPLALVTRTAETVDKCTFLASDMCVCIFFSR